MIKKLAKPAAVEFYDGNLCTAVVMVPASVPSEISHFKGKPRIYFVDYFNYRDQKNCETRLAPVIITVEKDGGFDLQSFGNVPDDVRRIFDTDFIVGLSCLKIHQKDELILGDYVQTATQLVKKGRDVKSRMHKRPLTPITTLKVDPEKLAIWKQASEKHHASGYTHDFPYVVEGFTKTNGKKVAGYARGGGKQHLEQRIELNELLKAKAEAADFEAEWAIQEKIDALLIKYNSPQAGRMAGKRVARMVVEAAGAAATKKAGL